MELHINGKEVKTASGFHRAFAKALDIETFYGSNLHALWDILTGGTERPLTIVWHDSDISRKSMGVFFDQIIDIFREVKEKYSSNIIGREFTYLLEHGDNKD